MFFAFFLLTFRSFLYPICRSSVGREAGATYMPGPENDGQARS